MIELELMLETLERMGYGGLVLGTSGMVLKLNGVAARLLTSFRNGNAGRGDMEHWRQSLKALLRYDGAERFRMDENAWIAVRRDIGQPVVLHAIPLPEGGPKGPHTVLIFVDLQHAPSPRKEALQKIFGLTPAEASLAAEIAVGKSLDQLAEERGVALGTVRKQLASIFGKTGTGRQSELVALLSRASILP